MGTPRQTFFSVVCFTRPTKCFCMSNDSSLPVRFTCVLKIRVHLLWSTIDFVVQGQKLDNYMEDSSATDARMLRRRSSQRSRTSTCSYSTIQVPSVYVINKHISISSIINLSWEQNNLKQWQVTHTHTYTLTVFIRLPNLIRTKARFCSQVLKWQVVHKYRNDKQSIWFLDLMKSFIRFVGR